MEESLCIGGPLDGTRQPECPVVGKGYKSFRRKVDNVEEWFYTYDNMTCGEVFKLLVNNYRPRSQ
jgi:hypothetical protein